MRLGAVACLVVLSLWEQRQKRLCQCQEACMWTSLASGVPSTLSPKAACSLPTLQSKRGWQSHAQHCCSVLEPSPQCTRLSGRRRWNNQAKGPRIGILPSLRTPSPGAPLALWRGKGVSRDEGEPAQENHFSFLGHFTLTLTGPHSVLTLTLS